MKQDKLSLKYLNKYNNNYILLPQDQEYKCPHCKTWTKKVYYANYEKFSTSSGLLTCGICGYKERAFDWKSEKFEITL